MAVVRRKKFAGSGCDHRRKLFLDDDWYRNTTIRTDLLMLIESIILADTDICNIFIYESEHIYTYIYIYTYTMI